MSKIKQSSFYHDQNLKETWSFPQYGQYEEAKKTWSWKHLPFGESRKTRAEWDKPPEKVEGSILEIGSAAGGAYAFMKDSGIVDLSDYTGLEISEQGKTFAESKYPEASWVQADATQYEPERNYDYVFERIAMHHMPDPISVMDKFSKVANKGFCATFVSCLEGDTISDLSVARYRHSNADYVYFDIINIFEVIETLLQNGFNDIYLYHGRLHEKVYHDPLAHQYVSPEVNWKKRKVGRCLVFARKTGKKDSLSISPSYSYLFRINRKAIRLIESRINRMIGKRDGVLYESAYNPV